MKTLDMLGQPCPIPVIEAKKELAQPGNAGVQVLVDNLVAVQNLEKMARGLGYGFAYEQEGGKRFAVALLPQGTETTAAAGRPTGLQEAQVRDEGTAQGATVLITCDEMGRGSEELGRILIKGFLFSLSELPVPPRAVLFLNAGVKLVSEGANTVADVQALAAKGTEVLACGTCLNYYGLTEKLAVGEVTDMFGIAQRLFAAGNTITL